MELLLVSSEARVGGEGWGVGGGGGRLPSTQATGPVFGSFSLEHIWPHQRERARFSLYTGCTFKSHSENLPQRKL